MQRQNVTPHLLPAAALLALTAFTPAAAAATLSEALAAYRDNRVAQAESMYTAIVADTAATPADRVNARIELARVDWLVRGETDAAAALLDNVPDIAERCDAAILTLRIFREAGQPQTSLAGAEASRNQCGPREVETLHVQLAQTHMALAASAAQQRAMHLSAAAAELAQIGNAAAGVPSVASARLSLALMQRDAAAAFAAWRAYFWLTDADAPQALSAYAGGAQAIFTAGLRGGAADADIVTLAVMLARAGFTADARLLAEETGAAARSASNPEWTKLNRFLSYLDTVRAIILRANREMATGGRANWLESEIQAATAALMRDQGLSGDPVQAMNAAYGAHGTIGETGGYPSMHAGFLVEDRTLAVEQYGYHGELHFRVIDNMIANGFESWLWDGWAQAGGWSGDGGIVQVRSAYTGGPLSALRMSRPGPARDRYLARLPQQEVEERAALGRDGVALLPATESRLYLQAVDRLAREKPNEADFIAEYWRLEVEYSITLHEGRHALDVQEPRRLSGADLEYRAKLSQIALSNYPRLGLANVINVQIDDSSHGQANRRILEGYRAWMRRHRSEIAGFDRNTPTLSQLDKLTDDQIVEAARSMDPWARERR